MLTLTLSRGVEGSRSLVLRDPTGDDERAVGSDAHALLARLSVAGEGRVAGEAVDLLPLGDRDQALAALHRSLYGDAVIADAVCASCGERYEIRFSMTELARSVESDGRADTVEVDGATFRLPTADDVRSGAGSAPGSPDAWARTLCVRGSADDWTPDQLGRLSTALEAASPIIDLELDSRCPECDVRNDVRFSIERFLGRALEHDRGFLLREVHLLARAYGWSFETLMSLTRTERQDFVRLVLEERSATSRLRRVA